MLLMLPGGDCFLNETFKLYLILKKSVTTGNPLATV